jgi:hypothetical protein
MEVSFPRMMLRLTTSGKLPVSERHPILVLCASACGVTHAICLAATLVNAVVASNLALTSQLVSLRETALNY